MVGALSVKDLLEKYEAAVTPRKKGSDQEKFRLRVLANSRLAAIGLDKLRVVDLVEFRNSRLKTVKANTVRNDINTLSAAIEWARSELQLGVDNPAAQVKKPSPGRGRDRRLQVGIGWRVNRWTRAGGEAGVRGYPYWRVGRYAVTQATPASRRRSWRESGLISGAIAGRRRVCGEVGRRVALTGAAGHWPVLLP